MGGGGGGSGLIKWGVDKMGKNFEIFFKIILIGGYRVSKIIYGDSFSGIFAAKINSCEN